jgi:NAD+ kinase
VELDDEDDDDEDDATESEAFDIDDTSNTATRTNSPDPDPPGSAPPNGLHSRRHSVRRSVSGEKRPRHHHSSSGLSSRSHHHSSAPASHQASHENLAARAGLAPLTKASRSANGSDDGKKSSPGSEESSQQASYQHGVIQPKRGHSLLDSPDRFGLAGPPQPPRAISERHLAHADFRLDDPQPPRGEESAADEASRRTSHASLDDGATAAAAKLQADTDDMASTPGNEKLSRAAAVLRGATEALHPSAKSPPQSSVEPELAAAAAASGSGSSRRRTGHRESRSRRASRDEVTPKPHRSQPAGSGGGGGGGTALIVRGLDESDSEIEGEY